MPVTANWKAASRQLKRADSHLAELIRRVGLCTLAPRRDYFVALCKAIYSQQLSTRVAAVLFARFRAEFPRKRPTPERVATLLLEDAAIKRCGLSRQKGVYLADLAKHFAEGRVRTRGLSRMSDEQIIEALTRVKGVGRWTAEMFLIFVLNRPDVLPVDDLGLREAVRKVYGMKQRPTAVQLTELGERWRPYRSIATWYLWRGLAADGKAKPVAKTVRTRSKRIGR